MVAAIILPIFPEDLLIQIFVRSTVESLIRAKCVCKQWYALIKNQTFVLNHIEYQKRHDKGRLLLQYFEEDTQEFIYALFDDKNLVSDTYHVIDHFPLCNYSLYMEGPVNGLYCLFNGKGRIVLWNPALKEVKALPLPHPPFFPHIKVSYGFLGFGIDPSTYDYKLVFIRRVEDDIGPLPGTFITLYNFTKNTWKLLDLGGCHLLEHECFSSTENSSYLSGTYYWWSTRCRLIAFDMADETFRAILGPDDFPDPELLIGTLTVYNDKVTLLLRDRKKPSIDRFTQKETFTIDVWVMLEEGAWIKQFSVTAFPNYLLELGLWKNDEIMVAMNGFETDTMDTNFRAVFCNAKTQEMRNVGPRAMPMSFKASIYYQSLVSVECGSGIAGKCASLNIISDFLDSHSNPHLNVYDQI